MERRKRERIIGRMGKSKINDNRRNKRRGRKRMGK
jgi:hypothetical protein